MSTVEASGHVMLAWACAMADFCYTQEFRSASRPALTSYRPYWAPLPHPTSSRNGVASRHREARSDPFMTDLCEIYFQKKTPISFPATYPTTNDNSRLQTFVQRLSLDKVCIFAAVINLNLQLWKHQNTLKASQRERIE
jgi:hypothetical protein